MPGLAAGVGKHQKSCGQDDDRSNAQKSQRDTGGLGSPVVRLHIKASQHQRRGEGVGREQEPALEEQNAISQEKGQGGLVVPFYIYGVVPRLSGLG